jgi:hypothetical protein
MKVTLFNKAILELLKEALNELREKLAGPKPSLKPVPARNENRKPHPFSN